MEGHSKKAICFLEIFRRGKVINFKRGFLHFPVEVLLDKSYLRTVFYSGSRYMLHEVTEDLDAGTTLLCN